MQARLEMAEMVGMEGIDMVMCPGDMVEGVDELMMGDATVDLFIHFSMWPLNYDSS